MSNISEHGLKVADQKQEQKQEQEQKEQQKQLEQKNQVLGGDKKNKEQENEQKEKNEKDEPKNKHQNQDEDEEERIREKLNQLEIDGQDSSRPWDIILISGADNTKFQCLRKNLVSKSDYFAAMFSVDMVEATAPEVQLVGVRKEMLAPLVLYSYTGEFTIDEHTVVELLRTASMLQFNEIVKICTEYRTKQLTLDNCLGIAADAAAYNLELLVKNARKFVLENFLLIVRDESYLQLDFEQLKPLIASDDLIAKSEQEVFEWIMLWVQHDLSERSKHIPALMALVRMSYMPHAYLNEHVAPVCEGADCKQLVATALAMPPAAQLPMVAPKITPRNWRPTKLLVVSLKGQKIVIELYCPKTDVWTPLVEMETTTEYFLADIINNQIVIINNSLQKIEPDFGSSDDDDSPYFLSDVPYEEIIEVVDLYTKQITSIKKEEHLLSDCDIAVLRGMFYAVGGQRFDRDCGIVERYDPIEQTWTEVAPLLTPRFYPHVAVLNDRLYAVGGKKYLGQIFSESLDPIYVDLNECYDPDTNTWTRKESMILERPASVVTASNKWLYAFGVDYYLEQSSLERYDPQLDTWTIMHSFQFNNPMACATLNGTLYTLDGTVGRDNELTMLKYDHVKDVLSQEFKKSLPEPKEVRYMFPVADVF